MLKRTDTHVIAKVDDEGWCRCGSCGHKLCRVMNWNNDIVIELKCHSCRKINILEQLSMGFIDFSDDIGYNNVGMEV